MGILGNLFGNSEDGTPSDFGMRLALAGQVLSAMSQGQQANIAPSIAALNERRRKLADEAKTNKWLQNQAAAMADKNPRLAAMLQDVPPDVGSSLIAKYYETMLAPPDWKTFESQGDIYRYNPLDPNSKPELFFDGPADPFKQLIQGVMGGNSAPGGASPAAPAPGSPPAATPDVPADSSVPPLPPPSSSLTGNAAVLAQSFGLPENATMADVMAVAQAGAIGGEDNARKTADTIIKRYEDAKAQGLDLSQKHVDNAFKLQGDYWRVGQTYQKVIDTANEVSALPDDPNGFERLMTLYKYMRSLDPAGAVRESDAAMAQNADNIWSKIGQIADKYTGVSGGDIPATAAAEMKRLILELGETANKADFKARKKVLKRAEAAGIPADKAEQLIFGSLQDTPEDMQGYTPRFQPGERQTDAGIQTAPDPTSQPLPPQPDMPRVTSNADFEALPSGTVFVDPRGVVRRKP